MKFSILTISLFFTFLTSALAQDIRDIAKKMYFPSDLPTPRFVISLPDSVKGISIVFEDIKSITPEKLNQLKNIELVQLCFSNQLELDKEVEVLTNFKAMKYLVLKDWKYGSKLNAEMIRLPKVLSNYKEISALSFSGEWKIDYEDGLETLKQLPKLQYLFFQDITQPIPEKVKTFKWLKGIYIHNSNNTEFPSWITELTKLESISIGVAKFSFKGSSYLNYFDVLSTLQKLPLLRSLYLNYLYNIAGDFNQIKFNNLEKISLESVVFKSNPNFINFLSNQKNLKSITISSSSPGVLNKHFTKLKQLQELSISGQNDSLYINFNLKKLKNLKSLKFSNTKLFLNDTEFPAKLEALYLNSTDLKSVPTSITILKNLKALDLSYDSLKSLPVNFAALNQLERLNISSNEIVSLPENFVELTHLKTLKFNANPIVKLPQHLEKLDSLTILEIQHGNLIELPNNIGGLKHLELLNLNDNLIAKLPESITQISSLKTLDLSYNQLTELPTTLGDLKALEDLQLSFNNIKIIPASISNLQSLKKLRLSFNDLDSIPEEISKLRFLEELHINTGEISVIRGFNYTREIYRKDDPNPKRKITANHLKNFPEDLSNWKSIKKLDLVNNKQINNEQLFKGLFSIPSKAFSLDLENCNITKLPTTGWENFFAQKMSLRDNQIIEIPKGIAKAQYLTEINLNKNKLSIKPNNLNQYVANKYEKLLWFIDLVIIEGTKLPKTDSMVLALINKSNNHYYRQEFKASVNLAKAALKINDSLTMANLYLTNIGEASYQVGEYKSAINYLTRAIKNDTAGSVRIMNFVVPDFEFRAKSYLKLGDTLSAIKDYETLAKRFSDSWGDAGLLYRAIGKLNEANIAFEKGIKKYQDQIDYFKKTKQPAEMHQLSLLELMLIKEDFKRAKEYALELENQFKEIQHITLLRYLKACALIGNDDFDDKNIPELETFIKANKSSVTRWGYELFFKWLRITKIATQKAALMRKITDIIKPTKNQTL